MVTVNEWFTSLSMNHLYPIKPYALLTPDRLGEEHIKPKEIRPIEI